MQVFVPVFKPDLTELAECRSPRTVPTPTHNTAIVARLPRTPGTAGSRVYLWRRRLATVAATALALVMAYGVVFGHNGLTAFAHKREEARMLEAERERLQRENERLRGHVERLRTDPAAIEHQARAGMRLARQGEVILVVQPTAPDPTQPAAAK